MTGQPDETRSEDERLLSVVVSLGFQRDAARLALRVAAAEDDAAAARAEVTRLRQAVERLLWQVKITHDAKGEPEPQWAAEIRAALGGVPEDERRSNR